MKRAHPRIRHRCLRCRIDQIQIAAVKNRPAETGGAESPSPEGRGGGLKRQSSNREVLDLGLDSQVLSTYWPNGDVGLAAHGALFHVGTAHAEIAKDGPQLDQKLSCLLTGTDIGFGDNL